MPGRDLRRLVALVMGLLVAVASLPWSVVQAAGNWKVAPRVSLSEIFTDNVNLSPPGEATKALVTLFRPGLDISGHGPRLRAHLSYTLNGIIAMRANNRPARGASNRYRNRLFHQLTADGNAELLKRHLFVDLRVRRRQFATTLAGPLGIDYSAGYVNLSSVTGASVSPYFTNHFGAYADSTLRYSYDRIFMDRGSLGRANTQSNVFSGVLKSGDAFGPAFWSLNASHTRTQRSGAFGSSGFGGNVGPTGPGRFGAGTFDIASATLGYRLSPHWSVSATGGYQQNNFKSFRSSISGPIWNVNLTWVPNRRAKLVVGYGMRYFGNTSKLNLQYRGRHTVWQAIYTQRVGTLRNVILANAGTVSIFSSGCPASDPSCLPIDQITVLRPEAVQGIFVLRRGRASVTLNGAKNSGTLAYVYLRRTYETNGTQSRQQGVRLNWTWRLKANLRFTTSGSLRQVEPLQTNGKTNLWSIRTRLTRDLGKFTHVSLAYRHQARIAAGTITGYDENALIATLSTRY